MDNRKFSKILRRYRLGEATDAENALVEQWYDLLDDEQPAAQDIDQQALQQRLWERIVAETGHLEPAASAPAGRVVSLGRYWKHVAAAAILVGVLIWWNGFRTPDQQGALTDAMTLAPAGLRTHANPDNASRKVNLPDGSIVTLAPGASLLAPARFEGSRREVYLEGEAFFDVARDASKPFYVYCGKVTTHVLGTSFNIKPMADGQQIEVAVRTGRVEVFENARVHQAQAASAANNGVVLTPNQRVVYHQASGLFEASVVNAPLPLIMEDVHEKPAQSFLFADAPLREVLEALEHTYGIEFIVEKNSLNDCPFTGDISEQNLFQKLDILNKALGTTYEVKGTRILIKGNGCE